MLILWVKFQPQKEFPVDFMPEDMYASKSNKRLLAVETVRKYEEKPAGAVRALVV